MASSTQQSEIRSRRLLFTTHSSSTAPNYSADNSKFSRRSCSPLPSFTSRWRTMRDDAKFLQRCAMRVAEVVFLAVAMFILPTMIQLFVHCVDEIYEIMGRRARSKFDSISWWHIMVGSVILLPWHFWISRLSIIAINEDRRKEERSEGQNERQQKAGTTWGRVLGRIIIPLYLIISCAILFSSLFGRLLEPVPTAATTERDHEGLHEPTVQDHW